jgi:uncharacterized protein
MEKEFPRIELDLGSIETHKNLTFNEDFSVPGPDGNNLECRVLIEAEVTRTGSRYLVEGGIKFVVGADCDRCLVPFEYKADTRFDIMLQKGGGCEPPAGRDDEDYVLLGEGEEYRYDIFPRVRESVLLELPIKYLCSEDCAGLCAVCGGNLNLERCTCKVQSEENIWEPLKKLLKDREDK